MLLLLVQLLQVLVFCEDGFFKSGVLLIYECQKHAIGLRFELVQIILDLFVVLFDLVDDLVFVVLTLHHLRILKDLVPELPLGLRLHHIHNVDDVVLHVLDHFAN